MTVKEQDKISYKHAAFGISETFLRFTVISMVNVAFVIGETLPKRCLV